MDNEMIEKVSRAILTTPNASDYNTLVAINAIKAMREPTEKMTMKGSLAIAADLETEIVYENMIDCIIND